MAALASLDDIIASLTALPDAAREKAVRQARSIIGKRRPPTPGPQTMGYMSEADILLFGGSPGGGKTALEVLLALNEHRRSLIVRRSFVDLDGVLHTLDNIVGKVGAASGGNRPKYEEDDRVIHFMGMGDDIGGKQGNPHDLICIDEAAQIPEDQFRMLLGWLRTNIPGQRCRVVLGSNPPLDTVGDWLVEYFAPWLDDRHPNPAEDGELRWFLPNENDMGYRECERGESMMLHGIEVRAHSRTFIRSSFTDNPYYDPTQYASTLAGLPDSVRKRLITGNFMDVRHDDPWQAIPTDWVKAAMQRWTSTPPVGVPMCAMGVDPAQGGSDETAIAWRHDSWFAPLITVPGIETEGGTEVAALVMKHRFDLAAVIVDIGGGWGGDAYAHLAANGVNVSSYMGVKDSYARTEDRLLHFSNIRTEAYWRFREALNPDRRGGSQIMLPNDKRLLSDLTTPLYKVKAGGIELETKVDVVKRLRRSPDRGDAVVMAWHTGAKAADSYAIWKAGANIGKAPRVVMGHQAARRRA